VIIAAQDNSFRYTFFNKAYAEEIKRLTGKDIHIGTSMVEVFAHMPEQQKIAVEEWSQVLRGESTSKTIEFGDPGRYGRVYNVLHTPLRDAEGNVVGAGEVAYDVTEHVRTQEALRDSEERLALALDAAELAPWGYDIVTDTVTPSSQMCKVYGIADASPLRTRADWRSFLLEEDLPTVRKAIDRADSRTGAYRVEYRVRRRSDGAVRWIASQGRLHRDAEGLPRRLVGVIADITERKQGEDALRKSEEKFELLSETASKLLATERPQEIVNELCQKVMSYLDCHAFFNYLVDEEKQCLRLNAYAGIPEEVAQEIEWLKYGVAVCGCAARDGSRIIAENIPETLDPRTDLVRSFGIKAYACHPLFARGRVIGTLSFGTRTRTRFTEDELALMKTVADQIAIAIERIQFLGELRRSREGLEVEVKKRTRDLNERVKELNCLYTISSVLDEPSLAVEKIFREIVDLIPSGWRFPEMSCARIVSQGEEIKSQNFKETSWKMSSDIIVHGKPVGAVEVYYLGEKPAGDEGPFLKEERTLIDTIATQLGEFIERKRAEEAVKLERQRFNDVLEILPAYLVLLTADYHVPFANRFFRERFGEAQGRRCFEYLFGRSEPCEICETYTALKTMAPHEWEWTGPDGRNYHVFDFPFTDTDGSTLILEMGIDITERKQAEKALKVASLYTRSLIEASLDPLVTISADGKVMDVNEATELVTGVSRENLIRSDFSSYFTDPQKAKEGYEEVFSKGFVRDYSLAIRHTSGSVTDVLYNATVYKDEAGEIQGVFAAARDITERKRAEEALKAASLYTRSLIEASLDPLVTISVDGKVMDVNKATELVTGVSREHLIGSDFSDYFSEPEKAREGYQQVFLKGSVRDYPLAIRHTSGRVTDVLYNATVYRNEAGEIQGVFAAARDITERKRAEQALQESEKQLRYLSSQLMAAQENERRRVARELHDGLGQYLTAIKFRVEGFLQETGKSRIKTKAKSLEAVIPIVQESVREIRRIQTDLRPSILDDLGILSTISWFCREFQTTYSHIRIEKEIDIREEMVPESLKMVIYRIMQEALNNISKHGQADLIRLAFRKTDGGLELSIQDNGQGFSLEEVLSAERAKQGLGLSSMRERAEHSGGSLLIESAKGKGTLIRAVWPI
jgi:PAS domain S-box-containing protein